MYPVVEGIVEDDNNRHLGRGVLYTLLRQAAPTLSLLDLSNEGAKKQTLPEKKILSETMGKMSEVLKSGINLC